MIKKIVFKADDILPSLQLNNAIISTKNTMPILSDVKIGVMKDSIILVTCDGETWVQTKVVCNENQDSGFSFCLESKSLLNALRSLSGKTCTMEIDDETSIVTCRYEKGYFQLPYEKADDFPMPTSIIQKATDDGTKRYINGNRLFNAINKVITATSNDEIRPIFGGVHIDFFKDGMVSVGTDGRKLVKYKDMTVTSTDEDVKSVTIPAKPCKALLSMLKDCDTGVLFDDSALCVMGNDFALVTRLIDGKYPNYNAVIPTDNCKVATIQKDDIISALKRVLPMGNVSSELVALSLTQGMATVSTEDVDFSKSASENILCEYNDEDITIGFKGSILLQMLQITDGEKVRIALRNPSSAGVITEDTDSSEHEFIALVMPMMLG